MKGVRHLESHWNSHCLSSAPSLPRPQVTQEVSWTVIHSGGLLAQETIKAGKSEMLMGTGGCQTLPLSQGWLSERDKTAPPHLLQGPSPGLLPLPSLEPSIRALALSTSTVPSQAQHKCWGGPDQIQALQLVTRACQSGSGPVTPPPPKPDV